VNELLAILANPTTREILMILKDNKLSTGDIAKKMNMSPPALSYHLNKMKKSGIIFESKYKNYIFYELDLTLLDQVIIWINNFKGEKTDEK
jgi:DNA-binding transcriptional ArsR family regulator